MGLEVGGLGKALAAGLEGADVGTVARVDPHVGAQVEVQGESLATPFKCALVGTTQAHMITLTPYTPMSDPTPPTWKGFSPVCTSWCRLSLELSTKALPHSAQTCTRGPWMCRCLRRAALSRNILLQPCSTAHAVSSARQWRLSSEDSPCVGREHSAPLRPWGASSSCACREG